MLDCDSSFKSIFVGWDSFESVLFSLFVSLESFVLDVVDIVETLDVALVFRTDVVVTVVDAVMESVVKPVPDDVELKGVVVVTVVVTTVVDDTLDVADVVLVVEVDVAVVELLCGFSCVFCCCSRCNLVVTPVVRISIGPIVELVLFTCNNYEKYYIYTFIKRCV